MGSVNVTSADLGEWAAHRRTVVLAVARRVPGVDPELAASHGLERLCAELIAQGRVSDPLTFWTTAAIDVADQLAAADLAIQQPASTEAITAPMRTLDLDLLNTAMERLPVAEQQLLWDHHVESRPVTALAEDIGVLPYAAKRRLRRAENRLASSFAETHVDAADDAECRSSRAAMHDFVRNRLLPRRRQKVEDHMVGCAGCTRAFVDVRESYWMLRAAAPVLLLGALATAKSGTAVAGVAAAGAATAGAGAGWLTALGTRAAVLVRSALTDPVSMTATVAGGLLVTTAITGLSGGAVDGSLFQDHGTVSVSAAPLDSSDQPSGGVPTRERHFVGLVPPRLTANDVETESGSTTGDGIPPGLTETDGVPPGLTKQDDVPPGLSQDDGVPPGLSETDGAPPGQTEKDDVPPGLADTDGVPPGLADTEGVPPGQARQDDVPPGLADTDGVPPGQAKKNQ